MAFALYKSLFGAAAEGLLDRDCQDWERHRIAPWTLVHARRDVGVGGFRLGFGDDGLEVLFHFLPEVWGQGLATEFLTAAMDHARSTLREDRFFGHVDPANEASLRVMRKAGFKDVGQDPNGHRVLRLK